MGEFTAALRLPVIVGEDGVTYTAVRQPCLNEGLALMEAAEGAKNGESGLMPILRASKTMLLAIGFPDEVVGALPAWKVMDYARDFFTESCIAPKPQAE